MSVEYKEHGCYELIYRKRFKISLVFSEREQLALGQQFAATLHAYFLRDDGETEAELGFLQVNLDRLLLSEVEDKIGDGIARMKRFCHDFQTLLKEEPQYITELSEKRQKARALARQTMYDEIYPRRRYQKRKK